jgi:hypothetical protein
VASPKSRVIDHAIAILDEELRHMTSTRFALFFCSGAAAAAGLVGFVAACSSTNAGLAPTPAATTSGADASTTTAAASAPTVAACAADGGTSSVLSFVNQTFVANSDPRLLRQDEGIFSGINTVDDPYKQVMRLTNGGTSPVTITSLGMAPQTAAQLFPTDFRQHSNPAAFKATLPSDAGSLPVTIAAGGSLDITVQFVSTKTDPPSRFDNVGGEAVAAWLVAETSTDCVQAGLYGVALWNDPESISDAGVPSSNYGRYEPTLGQIIATLGYQINVGENLKTFLNVNQVSETAMALPPANDTPSDEVVIRDLELADPTKPAVLLAPARFAPKVDFPFGWFPSGSVALANAQPAALPSGTVASPAVFPAGLQYVATMSSELGSDNYTSDHSEMVFPPITGNTAGTFTPTGSFGLWCYGNQRTGGSSVPNGDYDYSYDELNIVTQTANPPLPADLTEAGVNFGVTTLVHRYRFWPLKDRAGNLVANAYLVALEEATNDDYQDMIFTISNVKPATVVSDAGATGSTGADSGSAADGGTEQ